MEQSEAVLEVKGLPPGVEVELIGKRVDEQQPAEAKAPPALPTEEEILKEINEMGAKMRELIVKSKRVPRKQGYAPYQDPTRSLALAQAHLQTGFMWFRRSVTQDSDF